MLTEPAAHIAEGYDVVAVVLHRRQHQKFRPGQGGIFRQENEPVFLYGLVQRGAHVLPVGQQFGQCARIKHGAGQNMSADFRAFFQDNDFQVLAAFFRQLPQPDRRGQARRPAAYDHDIEFHAFAFHNGPDPRLTHRFLLGRVQ